MHAHGRDQIPVHGRDGRAAGRSRRATLAAVAAAAALLAAAAPPVAHGPGAGAVVTTAHPASPSLVAPAVPVPLAAPAAKSHPAAPARTPNWAGYVASGGVFTQVSGTWRIPDVTCGAADTYSAEWVGIDGYGGTTVEQIGVDVRCHDAVAHYEPWYEMFGDTAVADGAAVFVPSSGRIKPGDSVTAMVRVEHDRWTLSLDDTTSGWGFTKTIPSFHAQQSSAEWIVERPELCVTASDMSTCTAAGLATSDPVTFTAAAAARPGDGTRPAASYNPTAVEVADRKTGSILAVPSSFSGGSFSVTTFAGRSGVVPAVNDAGDCTASPFTDVTVASRFCGPIAWMKASDLTTGYPDGSFHPDASISRAALAAFLYRRADDGRGETITCTEKPFTDVAVTSRFCGPIAWMKQNGISTGYPDGSFHPDASISRAALAAFLYRSQTSQSEAPACTTEPFTDIRSTARFCGPIAWMKENGITSGFADGSFHPSSPMSRAAMAAFLYRVSTS